MGGFLVFQPTDPAGATTDGWARAERWFSHGKRLPRIATDGDGPMLAKFGRRATGASAVARDAQGWVATAGIWEHPDIAAIDDNEALLALLSERGPRVLQSLDGMYAIAWWDARSSTLTVCVDAVGRFQTFAASTDEGVYIATSAIAVARAARAAPDPRAIVEFLSTGTLREYRTPFLGVRRLGGGLLHRFRSGRELAAEPCNPLPWDRIEPGMLDTLVDGLLDDYDRLFRKFTTAPRRPLADLTGGLDSRLVVGFLARVRPGCPVTVTGPVDDRDVRQASVLAGRLGLDLRIVPDSTARDARRRPERVQDAFALSEANFDPIEYAGIAEIHRGHVEDHDLSLNGSGGALLRNYWWTARDADRTDLDPVPRVTHHLAAAAIDPEFLLAEFRLDPREHLAGVVRRTLGEPGREPMHRSMDRALLDLRIQCWQGSIASATNQVWANASPLLWLAPLRRILRADPWLRADDVLIHALLARLPAVYRTTLLATGFPPMPRRVGTAWRFVPGLVRAPVDLGRRVLRRARRAVGRPGRPALSDDVGALLESGLADVLDPSSMALRPFVDPDAVRGFRDAVLARRSGSPALVGRLLAVEWALSESASMP